MLAQLKAYAYAPIIAGTVLACLAIYGWGMHQYSTGLTQGKQEVQLAVAQATTKETARQLQANRQASEQSAQRITQLEAANADLANTLKEADALADADPTGGGVCLDANSVELHNRLRHGPAPHPVKP